MSSRAAHQEISITPRMLLAAYCQGAFPMTNDDGQIYWYDPEPRAILPLSSFHVSRSLKRTIRSKRFDVRIDDRFDRVMRACAEPAPGREETWISDEMILAYDQLFALGIAHSVEAWQDGRLAGGLYGVAINGLFAGESMFSCRRDASKVALVHLVEHMRERDMTLLDVQFLTGHLERFGAIEIPRAEYHRLLQRALEKPVSF